MSSVAYIQVPANSQEAKTSTERDFYTEVGLRLRKLRNSRRLTQEELAAKSGVSLSMIQRYERGSSQDGTHANPQLGTLLKLASAFDIEVSELLETRYDAQIDHDLAQAEEKWVQQAAAEFTNTTRHQ